MSGRDLKVGDPPKRYRWVASVFILVAITMDLMDATIIIIALPAIQLDIGATNSQMQWISAVYTLTFALSLVTTGRLGDMIGRKKSLLLGISGFILASFVCALAPGSGTLIAGRVLQGVTGAFILTSGLSMFQVSFKPSERATILGLFGAVTGLSAVLGPVVGGLLVHLDLFGLSWRPIFLINLPIGLITLIGVFLYARESRDPASPSMDPIGVSLFTGTLLSILFPLVQGRELGWPWWCFALMSLSVPLCAAFVQQQRRRGRLGGIPLIRPELLRQRAFVSGLVTILVFLAGINSLFFVFSIYLQSGLGFDPLTTGLTTMASALATVVTALGAPALSRRLGPMVLTVGALGVAMGQVMIILATREHGTALSALDLVPAMIINGLGLGLVVSPIVDIILSRVPVATAGSASGVLNTAEQLGSALGVAVVGTVYFSMVQTATVQGATDFAAHHQALQSSLWINVGLLLLSAALTLLLPNASDARDPQRSTTSFG